MLETLVGNLVICRCHLHGYLTSLSARMNLVVMIIIGVLVPPLVRLHPVLPQRCFLTTTMDLLAIPNVRQREEAWANQKVVMIIIDDWVRRRAERNE